jgi:ankyrin repeat protein
MEQEKTQGFMEIPSTASKTATATTETKPKTWWLWIDSNGHTLLHWAAKRGDDKRFVEFFLHHAPRPVLQELLHRTSLDNTAMTPLHWACTEPGAQSLAILSLFMKHHVNWETTDASGCTPLLIAAQYGQVEVCAYLLQKGRADLYARDTSMDTALHWAAYKGSLPVCGLLWWYHEQTQPRRGDLMAPDTYGQTPLHLASLRGHTSVVRYLLQRTAATKRDKLDLLYHKDTVRFTNQYVCFV